MKNQLTTAAFRATISQHERRAERMEFGSSVEKWNKTGKLTEEHTPRFLFRLSAHPFFALSIDNNFLIVYSSVYVHSQRLARLKNQKGSGSLPDGQRNGATILELSTTCHFVPLASVAGDCKACVTIGMESKRRR